MLGRAIIINLDNNNGNGDGDGEKAKRSRGDRATARQTGSTYLSANSSRQRAADDAHEASPSAMCCSSKLLATDLSALRSVCCFWGSF